MTIKAIRVSLKKDPVYLRLLETVEAISATVNQERIAQEAKTLHSGRTSRKLYKVAMRPQPIYEAITVDLKTRARLVELQASILLNSSALSQALKETKKYLSVKYQEEIADLASNQAGRTAVVDRLLQAPIECLAMLEGTEALLNLYITDLDKAGYGLTNVTNLLRTLLERNSQVV